MELHPTRTAVMSDEEIIALFWQRDEQAIRLAQQRHGPYCLSIARRILRDRQDAEECVNDTYVKVGVQDIVSDTVAITAVFFGGLLDRLLVPLPV